MPAKPLTYTEYLYLKHRLLGLFKRAFPNVHVDVWDDFRMGPDSLTIGVTVQHTVISRYAIKTVFSLRAYSQVREQETFLREFAKRIAVDLTLGMMRDAWQTA